MARFALQQFSAFSDKLYPLHSAVAASIRIEPIHVDTAFPQVGQTILTVISFIDHERTNQLELYRRFFSPIS